MRFSSGFLSLSLLLSHITLDNLLVRVGSVILRDLVFLGVVVALTLVPFVMTFWLVPVLALLFA